MPKLFHFTPFTKETEEVRWVLYGEVFLSELTDSIKWSSGLVLFFFLLLLLLLFNEVISGPFYNLQ